MLRIFYACPICGYQHPVVENGDSFSPEMTLSVKHYDDRLKQFCPEEIINRVDESFSLDDAI